MYKRFKYNIKRHWQQEIGSTLIMIYWKVGPTAGIDDAFFYNPDCADVYDVANGNCTNGWKYYNGKQWVDDPTIKMICEKGSLFFHYNYDSFNIDNCTIYLPLFNYLL